MLPRPGDLTVPLSGGPIDFLKDYPVNDVMGADRHELTDADGMLCVLAHVGSWLYVLTSTQRLGWVYEYDVGPGKLAGSVYHIR